MGYVFKVRVCFLIGTFALLLALSVPVSVSIIISSVVTMASTLSLDLGTVRCQPAHGGRR